MGVGREDGAARSRLGTAVQTRGLSLRGSRRVGLHRPPCAPPSRPSSRVTVVKKYRRPGVVVSGSSTTTRTTVRRRPADASVTISGGGSRSSTSVRSRTSVSGERSSGGSSSTTSGSQPRAGGSGGSGGGAAGGSGAGGASGGSGAGGASGAAPADLLRAPRPPSAAGLVLRKKNPAPCAGALILSPLMQARPALIACSTGSTVYCRLVTCCGHAGEAF
jgi:hypothetical protein